MEKDGFTLVSRRKSKNTFRIEQKLNLVSSVNEEGDFDSSIKAITTFGELLEQEKRIKYFLRSTNDEFYRNHTKKSGVVESSIVCYGLGNVSSRTTPQIQLAFLLMLSKFMNSTVEAYDPVFTKTDKKILKSLNIKLIDHNESGMRKTNGSKVIFYMPHCDKFLYNNLLWANWTAAHLSNVLIIGNSFKDIVRDNISSNLNKRYKYIALAETFCTEFDFPLVMNPDCDARAFNNLALISFTKCLEENLDPNIWVYQTKPTYADDELLPN